MSGTNLYRALTQAGAGEDLAKAAADDIDNIDAVIARLDNSITELRIISRANIAISIAILAILLKSFI